MIEVWFGLAVAVTWAVVWTWFCEPEISEWLRVRTWRARWVLRRWWGK
jgi:hypothetical protein